MCSQRKTSELAQTLVEYTLVLGAVLLVLFALSPLIRRSIQGMIKVVADQVGVQNRSDQAAFERAQGSQQELDKEGYLVDSRVGVSARMDKQTRDVNGTIAYTHGDATEIHSNALINLGFTEQQGQ